MTTAIGPPAKVSWPMEELGRHTIYIKVSMIQLNNRKLSSVAAEKGTQLAWVRLTHNLSKSQHPFVVSRPMWRTDPSVRRVACQISK